ncbi:MAG: hypothetical protein P1U62_14040 [Alteraurantiacibacter sp. bin_em_oilr2.035]|nr:hypothetical protein [Alteraurantiacibacter sp. bin_em_oilr2.035]
MNLLILQSAYERRDRDEALRALDRLLLVYPSTRQELIPVFAQSLAEDEAQPAYREILRRQPEWADAFFSLNSLEDDALRNLAKLRLSLANDIQLEPEIDRNLVTRLARRGMWSETLALHRLVAGERSAAALRVIDWRQQHPPFDWELADERNFHARARANDATLAIHIGRGKGGELARRIIRLPPRITRLALDHTIQPRDSAERLKLSVLCPMEQRPLASETFGPRSVSVDLTPDSCEWVEIRISGRARSTGEDISGEVSRIKLIRAN